MCTPVVLSTFLWPYMVVNHAGEGGVIASLSVSHVTWKQEVLCRREEQEERKGKVSESLDGLWTRVELCRSTKVSDVVTPSVGRTAETGVRLGHLRIPLPGLQDVQVWVKHKKQNKT